MRLVLCIVQDQDVNRLLGVLMDHGYSATKLASTGGFLRQGNTTLFVGVEAEKVDEVVQLINDTCRSRKQLITPLAGIGRTVGECIPNPVEVSVGGATIFVLDVERFVKV
jgi:uncharacterized protein YaaQ